MQTSLMDASSVMGLLNLNTPWCLISNCRRREKKKKKKRERKKEGKKDKDKEEGETLP
jgi:hypothetical protein